MNLEDACNYLIDLLLCDQDSLEYKEAAEYFKALEWGLFLWRNYESYRRRYSVYQGTIA